MLNRALYIILRQILQFLIRFISCKKTPKIPFIRKQKTQIELATRKEHTISKQQNKNIMGWIKAVGLNHGIGLNLEWNWNRVKSNARLIKIQAIEKQNYTVLPVSNYTNAQTVKCELWFTSKTHELKRRNLSLMWIFTRKTNAYEEKLTFFFGDIKFAPEFLQNFVKSTFLVRKL